MEGIKININGNISINEFDNLLNLIRCTLIGKGFTRSDLISCMVAASVYNGDTVIPITIIIGEG